VKRTVVTDEKCMIDSNSKVNKNKSRNSTHLRSGNNS